MTQNFFLIADDSPGKLHFLRSTVERSGWPGEILMATTTEDAMELIDAHTEEITAAFIDFYIPSTNGPAVIAYLKKKSPQSHIALVSSANNSDNNAKAKAAGAERTICTSNERDHVEMELLDTIEEWKMRRE